MLIIYIFDIKMNELGKRIQQLRKEKGLSQTELAGHIGVSYAQLSRYEIKGAQPPAEVLNKMADALGTSVDFLINGNTSEKAQSTLRDAELLKQFREIDQMPDNEKSTIIKVISAYIRDYRTRQAYAS
jgi:transcriptional regulator with XRE-family HTH domain